MIPMFNIQGSSASIQRTFADAVIAICDSSKGLPVTQSTIDAIESQLNFAAKAAFRSGELLNEEAPRAVLRFHPQTRSLTLFWSEKPVLRERREEG